MAKATAALNRQADIAWAAIRDSPVRSVYLVEVHDRAADVVRAIDAALALVPDPPVGSGYITVNREIHQQLLHALGAAARIKAMCFERGQGSKQTALEHKVQCRRARWLASVLTGIDLEPIADAQVRNTVEHFDEYVDRAALGAYDGTIPRPVLVPIDMALSTRHLLSQFAIGGETPSTYWVRVFIADEVCFINCGHEVNVKNLRVAAAAVVDRLDGLIGGRAAAEGSSMLVLTAESFRVREPSG